MVRFILKTTALAASIFLIPVSVQAQTLDGTVFSHVRPYTPNPEDPIYFTHQNRSHRIEDPGVRLNDHLANMRYLTRVWSNWAHVDLARTHSGSDFLRDVEQLHGFFESFSYHRMHAQYIQYTQTSAPASGERFQSAKRSIRMYQNIHSMYSDMAAAEEIGFRDLARQLIFGLLGKSTNVRNLKVLKLQKIFTRFRYFADPADLSSHEPLEGTPSYKDMGAHNIFKLLKIFHTENQRSFTIILWQEVLLAMKLYPHIDRIMRTSIPAEQTRYQETLRETLQEVLAFQDYRNRYNQMIETYRAPLAADPMILELLQQLERSPAISNNCTLYFRG